MMMMMMMMMMMIERMESEVVIVKGGLDGAYCQYGVACSVYFLSAASVFLLVNNPVVDPRGQRCSLMKLSTPPLRWSTRSFTSAATRVSDRLENELPLLLVGGSALCGCHFASLM